MAEEVWKEFEENSLTHSAAHHLMAVLDLKESNGYARVSDVAKVLSITTGSASTNLKSLKGKGLVVEDENKFLSLSNEGERLAKLVLRRKKVLETFLVDILRVDKHQAEVDACKTEHLISIETTQKLEKFVQNHLKSN